MSSSTSTTPHLGRYLCIWPLHWWKRKFLALGPVDKGHQIQDEVIGRSAEAYNPRANGVWTQVERCDNRGWNLGICVCVCIIDIYIYINIYIHSVLYILSYCFGCVYICVCVLYVLYLSVCVHLGFRIRPNNPWASKKMVITRGKQVCGACSVSISKGKINRWK